MYPIEKGESIKVNGRLVCLVHRRCYGYDLGPDGKLVVNANEAAVVCWIFDQYLDGDSLSQIVSGLEEHGIASPRGKPKWNKEAINILLSNEKYTGRILLQKTIHIDGSRIKNDGRKVQYLIPNAHEAIIPDEVFREVQEEKVRRTNCPQNRPAIQMLF